MLEGLPGPLPDLDTQPFWDGCNEGRFLLPTCHDCGTVRWPPGPMCPACQSEQTDWVDWTGPGKVYSWTVVHHAAHPALAEQIPYIIALVEVAPSVRVLGNVIGCAPEDMRADMEVELFFEDAGEGEQLPNFRVPT